MNKVLLLAATLIIPASLSAEINVNVHIDKNAGGKNVSNSHIQGHQVAFQYIDDGEPWFEELSSNGTLKTCFEYQWTLLGKQRVLRFRQISFDSRKEQWKFGEWQNYNTGHKKPYKTSSNWHKTYQRRGREVICIYEYTYPNKFERKDSRAHRYEYVAYIAENDRSPVKKTVETTIIKPDGVYKSKTVTVKKEQVSLNTGAESGLSKVSGRERLK